VGALAIESNMKLQKQAMGLIGGRYATRPRFALEAIRRADKARGQYQEAIRSYLAGKWSEENVHIADAMGAFTMEARQSRRNAVDWMQFME